MHKTLLIDLLTYVQYILQPSFICPFDVVDPMHLHCLQCLCHNLTMLADRDPLCGAEFHFQRSNGIVMG